MPDPSKRLAFLVQQVEKGSTDPFAWYALALEYRGQKDFVRALSVFEELRAKWADYVPMYLLCGQMLAEELGDIEKAREWLEAGAVAARAKRETHALGELEAALSAL
jgi:hypothetical protein